MAHDVFISYSDKDRLTVTGISTYLEQKGIRCFVAYRDIPKGIVWAGAITEAIKNCEVMVIVFSENFNSSIEVDREIQLCSKFHKPMLVFRLSASTYDDVKMYYLSNVNHLDAFPYPEREFDKLAESIQRLIYGDSAKSKHTQDDDEKEDIVEVDQWDKPKSVFARKIKSIFSDKSKY